VCNPDVQLEKFFAMSSSPCGKKRACGVAQADLRKLRDAENTSKHVLRIARRALHASMRACPR